MLFDGILLPDQFCEKGRHIREKKGWIYIQSLLDLFGYWWYKFMVVSNCQDCQLCLPKKMGKKPQSKVYIHLGKKNLNS